MVHEARYIYSTVLRVTDFTHPRWQLRMVKIDEENIIIIIERASSMMNDERRDDGIIHPIIYYMY